MADRRVEEEQHHRELQRRADRISSLIVASDYPAIDVIIEIRKLRDFAEERFPGRMYLFEGIYGKRFRRLWEQFRSSSGEELPDW